MFQVPNSYLGTAMALKYPPVGNVQQSSQGSVGSSNSQPKPSNASGNKSGYQAPGAIPGQPNQHLTQPGPGNYNNENFGGGNKGSGPQGGSIAAIHNVGNFNSNNQNQNYGNYSPYVPSNPYAMVSPDSTGLQPFGGSNTASNFYDPYSATGNASDVFNSAQNNPGFNTQGLQTGSANIGPQSYSATPYAGVGGLGSSMSQPSAPAGIPSFGGGSQSAIPQADQFSSNYGGGGAGGADTWSNVSSLADQFNPVSSASADTFNSNPYQPFTQDQGGNGGYSGGIQPVQPVQDTTGGYSAPAPTPSSAPSSDQGGGYTPQPQNYSNSGGYGGYAAGGTVRGGHQRHGIPLRPGAMLPPSVTNRMLPSSFARGGPTTGGQVPRSASPSQGRQTDDIPARLNANEFVMPRDVTKYYGHKFFLDLIKKSRAVTGHANPAAVPSTKPMSQSQMQHPRFVSSNGAINEHDPGR